MSEAMPLQPEQSFARGRFVLVKRLGRGGMGEVWLARDERLREPVALKFLPPEIRGDAGALDDLCRETARSHKLSHANIVRIHDLYEDPDGMAFIVMEYIDGPTLAALRLQQPSRVLSWDYLRPLVAQLCAALEYAHGEKVIHRDLKPANLMVDSRGRLKLADFGIAAVASDSMSRISMRHSTSGTLPYMSPQQLTGQRPQPADDIYALGATLYELLTGKPPFHTGDITHQVLHQAPEPMEDRLAELGMANDIPPEAAALVMACLAKEPGQRPPSARAVAEWIGLELEAKPTTESLAAALFPQTPSRPEAVAGEPAEDSPSTPAGDGGPPMPPGMLVPGRVSKGAGYGWKLAAVGIVALVIAGAFWLRRDNLRRNHSNPLAAAKVPGQTAELAPEQIPSTATPATPAAPAASAKTEAQPPPQKTVPNPAASNQPGWISSEVPKPGADGWIVLFDGKRLYGCSPPNADTASGKLIVQDGCLKVDSTSIRFNLTGRDLVIRARLKKVSGENCGISLRNDDKGGDCYAWFDGSNYFGLGRNIGGKPTNFVNIHAGENYDGFFEMEFRAEGRNLTLKADGRIICQAYDNSIIGGVCHAGTLNGITFFQSIEARILDKTPSTANVESQSRTAKVPPQEATTPPANPTEHNANAAATAVAGVPSSNVPAPAAVGQKETGPSTIGKAGSSGAKDAPRITSQPASQSVLPGANVTFKVTVAGDGPFTYQWRLDGAGLPDTIRTVAGNGKQGYSGDGGAAINASLNYPCGVALDAAGNLYIVDNNNERIRKVDTKGIITTVAGNGGKGYSGDGGPAANASLDTPYGVALDPAANLYIADRMNNRIRKLGAKGIITTVAGNGGRAYSGDGGPAANTSLNLPLDMAFDAAGSMYIADYVNQRIRMVDSQGIITTVAGNGNDGYSGDGGAASKASLSRPAGVAFDAADDLYIADCYNHRVRKLDSKGVITTVAGNGMPDYSGDGGAATKASLGYLHRLAFDAFGNLYIADSSNNRIRKVDINGIIATVAGNGYGSTTADVSGGGTYSGDGGAATSASLNYPFAVASDAFGRLYIADSSNHRIREVHLAGLPELAIIHVSATNAGNYTVVISNPHGSVTSAVAALTVKGTQP